MRKAISFLLVAIFVAGAGSLYARKWTQAATGRQIDAEFVKLDGSTAHLKLANGRVVEVPAGSLSKEDQEFIKAQANASSSGSGAGGGWPRFRGPNLDGISPDTNLIDSIPDGGPEKLWEYDDAGNGYSSFSVVGDKLYTLGTRGDDFVAICINTSDGKEVWSKKLEDDDQKGYNVGWGHGPRSTPSVSDGKLCCLDPKGGIYCLNAEDGSKIWSKNLISDFGGKAGGWGFSASPMIDGDLWIVAPGGEQAGLVALNKESGSVVWSADDVKPGKAEYATVIPCEINGVKQYVRLFEKELVGVAAEDGKKLWSSPWEGRTAVIPTPIVDGNQIYITSGYGVGCKLVEVGADWSTEDVWINKEMKNHHGGVVKVGKYLYGFSDGAGLICQEWDTGAMVWNEKGQYTSKGSVTIADGKIFALNEGDGTLIMAEADNDSFKGLGQFTLEPQSDIRHNQGKIWSHPLVIDGKLYLRDQDIIVCYNVKK